MNLPHCTIPQCVIDLANSIDWPNIHVSQYGALATQLWSLISGRGLPQVRTIIPVSRDSWPSGLVYDVPEVFINVLLRVDWTRVPGTKQQSLARQLSGIIFSPLVGMPRRHWKN
ncbi:MAG: hypothetical protein ABI876_01910 [Bacteroidota bacterium]